MKNVLFFLRGDASKKSDNGKREGKEKN
jgi:hypothetical protein